MSILSQGVQPCAPVPHIPGAQKCLSGSAGVFVIYNVEALSDIVRGLVLGVGVGKGEDNAAQCRDQAGHSGGGGDGRGRGRSLVG